MVLRRENHDEGASTLLMSEEDPTSNGENDFVKRSSLYQEFLAEREEILRYKWLESERLGKDIGFERALLDWIRKHRDGWRSARRSAHSDNVDTTEGSSV